MSLSSFKASTPLTLGVELELQLIDLTDLDLTPVAHDLLHWLKRKPFPGEVKPEITTGMIEISTDPQERYDPLLQQLLSIRDRLVDAAQHLNMGICGGGAHPFQHWPEQRIFPTPRFEKLSHLYGYLAKQFTIFGQHIHVGCRNADEAMYLLHALNRYIPHFIALSASSPFLYGVDTQFDSARLNFISAFPLSGHAPFLLNWNQFSDDYFNKMKHTGIVESMKDFYWDMRPKPEFGTLELRICDTPLTIHRAAQLAAYLQALCHLLLQHAGSPLNKDDDLVYNFNRFQACRFGLEATLIHPSTHQHLLLREDILNTLRALAPHAITLGSQDALVALEEIAISGNDAAILRQHYSGSGRSQAIVLEALQRFRT